MITRHDLILLFSFLVFFSCGTPQEEYIPSPVSEYDTLLINGIRQVIHVEGTDRDLPMLLYLHGGPGESVMQRAEDLTGKLDSAFLVVHWDQRGAGATAALNPEDSPPDMNLMGSDARLMIDSLLKAYDHNELFLVGHSWGTVLGFDLVRKMPDKITAFIAISPQVNEKRSTELLLDTLENHFLQTGNARAVAQLDTLSVPMANLEQMIALHRWQSEYHGKPVSDEEVAQFRPYLKNWEKQWWTVYQEMSAIDRSTESHNFEVPVIFILGKRDLQTNYLLSINYFEKLQAPVKNLFLLDSAGHNLPGQFPEIMQENILKVKNLLVNEKEN